MSIDTATVTKVARLARLEMDQSKIAFYAQQMNRILGFVDMLNQVNTDGIAPLSNVSDINLRLREDRVTDGNKAEAILQNAPEQAEGFFVVPKVVE